MNEKVYELYGTAIASLERARSVVEEAVQIRLEPHESGYRCGNYYRFGDVGDEHFILQLNFDEIDGEWTEPEHTEYPLILYVNESERSDQIAEQLGNQSLFKLLRRQEL